MSATDLDSELPSMNSVHEVIAITGISGRFPESNNIDEFKRKLFDGVDLVTEDSRKWPSGINGLPTRSGRIRDLQYFDATFFGAHSKQAHAMDPQLRMLLESTYEAIVDAGVNPTDIRGSKTGVFIGVCTTETFDYMNMNPDTMNGYSVTGCCRPMLPNRISYTFDLIGPSCAIDSSCSSSLSALQHAETAIRNGDCEAAIVGGVNLILNPTYTLQFQKLGVLSPDGKCKAFDISADGYVRSEAVVTVFLQKASVAKRIYATIVGARTNTDGYKAEGITFPSGAMQKKLIGEFYDEIGINPLEVSYIEAHGTGTRVGDPQEVNSIADFFCKNRKDPLLIGSLKSNMGHSEPASGLCSLVKIVIAMESGMIPQNLHFQIANPDIPALNDGRLKVVTENVPWNGGLIAVNSLGFGGTNVHVVLRSNPKVKQTSHMLQIPRLVGVSGRTEQAVEYFLLNIERNKQDEEFLVLLDEIHRKNVNGHDFRGYTVLNDQPIPEIIRISPEKRAIVFVYPGVGAQWPGMAKELMKLDCFRNSVRKCADVLKQHGIDLENVLTNEAETILDNIVNSFISITAMHVALTDVLNIVGVEPDMIIGHSVGEIGCAYADGTLTREQAILAAYARGHAILESEIPTGAMAAVGLSLEETRKRCPPEIFPACHNSDDSVTISGPQESIEKFIEELHKDGIFAKKIKTSGIAFHSKYIAEAGPNLRQALDVIIPSPRPRSSKWISSSIPETEWGSSLAKYSSSAYFVNNFISPVLFNEALKYVPVNAIVIEIDSNGLLQSILKRKLGTGATIINLVKRNNIDKISSLLSAIGKIYIAGAQPEFGKLYPSVEFPVGRGTQMINSMIEWDHSIEWSVADFSAERNRFKELVIEVDLSNELTKYLSGNVVDGKIVFPVSGYLVIVWKSFAKLKNMDFQKLPVVFTDVHFHRTIIISDKNSVRFLINILEGTGGFEVCENGSVVASGKISVPEDASTESMVLPELNNTSEEEKVLRLTSNDIYKELRLRGYDYRGIFKGIIESDGLGLRGTLAWKNNWTTFIDTMLQFSSLRKNSRDLYVITRLQRLSINPNKHLEFIQKLRDGENIPIDMFQNMGVVKSVGIEIYGIISNQAPCRRQDRPPPKLETYQFVPYDNTPTPIIDPEEAKQQALLVLLQIVIENSPNALTLNVTELFTDKPIEAVLAPIIKGLIENEPMMSTEVTVVTTESVDASILDVNNIKHEKRDINKYSIADDAHLIVTSDIFDNNNYEIILKNAIASIRIGGFILVEEIRGPIDIKKLGGLEIISKQLTKEKMYILLRRPISLPTDSGVIQITDSNFTWIEPLKELMLQAENDNRKVYIYVDGEEISGIIGMVNCLRLEPGGSNLRCVFIRDTNAPKFSISRYESHLKKDLVHNVLRNNTWGSFRHLPVKDIKNSEKFQVEHVYIDTLIKGDLASLKWIEGPLGNQKYEYLHPDFCYIYYAALNYRDVMLATRKIPLDVIQENVAVQNYNLGVEFSGRDTSGKKVMGIVDGKALATMVLANSGFLWEVPEKWSLKDAATIPLVYATSYYALIVRGGLKPGESVLVHAGTSGVGQASITIALQMGCTVFTTVSSQVERDFLRKSFSQLRDKNIGDSRDISFEQMVKIQTNGRGVDCVLNSLVAHQLQASVRCLAVGGRFLEIGRADMFDAYPLRISMLSKNITFHGIDLNSLLYCDSTEKRHVKTLVTDGIKNGIVQPLCTTIFKTQQVEEAFRFMTTQKYIGKVLIQIRNEENIQIQRPPPSIVCAIPRTYMHPKKSYVLVGGLGGFGLELTNWLITRGATKIVLSSRTGIRTGYQSLCIRRWRKMGIEVHISTADITVSEGAKILLEEAIKLGPVGGIFNLAVVLRDALMENQSEANFEIVCKPKIDGTKLLDVASRIQAPQLDYFVTFSSIACSRGNAGQSNYGFANSSMERIVESRQAAGFPGMVIQWGAIGDVGILMETMGGDDIVIQGTSPQSMSSCLQTIDVFLQHSYPVVGSLILAEKKRVDYGDDCQVNLKTAVCDILGIDDIGTVSPHITLADIGMDSLMVIDIKQIMERNYNLLLSSQEIRALSFARLIELSACNETPAILSTPKPQSAM
ncbi:unnamed protein product [Phaedon cochleariae]|uniref:Fatty acid synthase n=1 Tax=Phaedon cochleariae TaxID=80249 RepID=A0A9P0DRQ6_PHACE|nr:unnamed protein product [Phaedon cochleariae]